jgi:hypothetical protein
MKRTPLIAIILAFYLATHGIAWFFTDSHAMIYRLLAVLVLVASALRGVRYAQEILALCCAIFAILGLHLLLRLEADPPIYIAVGLYSLGSAILSWLVMRSRSLARTSLAAPR